MSLSSPQNTPAQSTLSPANVPRKEVLADGVEIWCGDCRDVLPLIGRVDAVVTDPPYGIDIASAATVGATGRNGNGHKLGSRCVKSYEISDWDKVGLDSDRWRLVRASAPDFIVWGGNHLAHVLGSSAGVLVWDKKCQNGWDDTFSEMEIAWISSITRAKGFRHLWAGAIRASEHAADTRQHPTQKPIVLMEWCLGFLPDAKTICDPYCGSGTTGVACVNLGRKFIGIEREPKYFDIARRRISEALRQPSLFIEKPKPTVQEPLL